MARNSSSVKAGMKVVIVVSRYCGRWSRSASGLGLVGGARRRLDLHAVLGTSPCRTPKPLRMS
jgi:hypothetical protein